MAIKDGHQHYVIKKAKRGKLISPCGSGKSLTAYWIARDLEARCIVIAVPSLALIRQTLKVWLRETLANRQAVEWICVCSDESAGRIERDDVSVLRQDLGVPCLTDPDDIIALTVLRHPQEKQNVRLVNEVLHEAVAGLSSDETVEFVNEGKSTKMRVDEIHKFASDGKDAIQSRFLRDMPQLVMDGAETLVKRRWGVIVSDVPVFLTSDCPVVLCRGICQQSNFGYETPGTRILFPFSPTRLLIIDDSLPRDFAHYVHPNPDVFNEVERVFEHISIRLTRTKGGRVTVAGLESGSRNKRASSLF